MTSVYARAPHTSVVRIKATDPIYSVKEGPTSSAHESVIRADNDTCVLEIEKSI